MNNAFDENYGYRTEDLRGKPFHDIVELQTDITDKDTWQQGYLYGENGKVYDVIGTTRAVEDKGVTYLSCQLVDITHLRLISENVLMACEQEEEKIGMYLRKDIGQRISGIKMLCDTLRRNILFDKSTKADQALEEIAELLQQTNESIDETIHTLIPRGSTSDNLQTLLELVTEEIDRAFDLDCQLRVEDMNVEPSRLSVVLYRIAQQAARLAANHPGTEGITVRLSKSDDQLELSVETRNNTFSRDTLEAIADDIELLRYQARLVRGRLDLETHEGRTIFRVVVPSERQPE